MVSEQPPRRLKQCQYCRQNRFGSRKTLVEAALIGSFKISYSFKNHCAAGSSILFTFMQLANTVKNC